MHLPGRAPLLFVLAGATLLGCSSSPVRSDGRAPDAWKDSSPDAPRAELGPPDRADRLTDRTNCAVHCDCPQGQFCYLGKCVLDSKSPVYCCAKSGCPPGRWCFDAANKKATCAESTTWPCNDACDCGPAHCCKKGAGQPTGICVKDDTDAWLPGGTVVGSRCTPGVDATYCCDDASCHAGKLAAGGAGRTFLCRDRKQASIQAHCSGASCFGTACNCGPGESCVDTTATTSAPGKTCLLLSGGACVSNAVASAVYGWPASELLPCCAQGCLPGAPCDRGWRADGEYAYARITAVCGGACGNGSCDPGESATSCPADCAASCGDGACLPEEVASCPADCAPKPKCGLGSGTWSKSTICGDGLCQGGRSCDWSEAESCLTCPQDCGACSWRLFHSRTANLALTRAMKGVWGSSAKDVFIVGDGGTVVHYDGLSFAAMATGSDEELRGVWGSSPSDVFAVGSTSTVLHYDGVTWSSMGTGPLTNYQYLYGVWGSSGKDVFAVGQTGSILHYDGSAWTVVASGTTSTLWSVWGSSASDVYAVGDSGTILHYDGKSWKPESSGTSLTLLSVWGSSATNVFAVGSSGTILRRDGTGWTTMSSGVKTALVGVWGSSAGDVYAVGPGVLGGGVILHHDGTGWKTMGGATQDLFGLWGSSATDLFAVGDFGEILHGDGVGWTELTSGKAHVIRSLWGSSPSDLYAVGSPLARHFDGVSWTELPIPAIPGFTSVWGSAANDVHVVGKEMWHYDGASWKKTTTNTLFWSPNAIWGSSSTDVVVVGQAGNILHGDGTSWTPMSSGTSAQLSSVWGSSAADIFVVGELGTILHFDGTSWKAMASGTTKNLAGVWGSSAIEVFAAGGSSGSSVILRYDGVTWKTVSAPSTWLLAIAGTSASNVFTVGYSGTILHYDGNSWSAASGADLREPPAGSTCRFLNAIGSAGPGTLFVVGEGELILRYCAKGICP
jgi:hypothetical protein